MEVMKAGSGKPESREPAAAENLKGQELLLQP